LRREGRCQKRGRGWRKRDPSWWSNVDITRGMSEFVRSVSKFARGIREVVEGEEEVNKSEGNCKEQSIAVPCVSPQNTLC
jgi:hypothetical protein